MFDRFEPLRLWCQKVLPLVYDDSLSYYEVLCKLTHYINKMGEDISSIPAYIQSLLTNGTDVTFNTVNNMIDANLTPGMIVKTLGYRTNGDMGGLTYVIGDTNMGFGVQLSNGKWANPVFLEDYVTPQMLGAYANGSNNDSGYINAAFGVGKPVNLIGTYLITSEVAVPSGGKLYSINGGTLKKSGEGFVAVSLGDYSKLIGVTIEGTQYQTQVKNQSSYEVVADDVENVIIRDCTIKKADFTGIMIRNCNNVIIDGNTIDRYGYCGIMLFYMCKDIKITNNSILHGVGITLPNRYAIILGTGDSNDDTYKSKGIICDSNYIEDDAPYWEGIDAHGLEDSIISNNVIINTLSAIALTKGNTVRTHKRITIMGNVIKMTGSCNFAASTGGIAVQTGEDISIMCNTVSITGNNTGTTDKYGIKISAEKVTVSENVLSLPHTGDWRGIFTESRSGSDCLGCNLNSNVIDTDYNGIQVTNYSRRTTIKGFNNTLRNCATGIYGVMQPDQDNKVYRSPCFFKQSTFENVATQVNSNGRGCYTDFDSSAPSTGLLGDIIFNSAFNGSNVFCWVCTTGYTDSDPAVWTAMSLA